VKVRAAIPAAVVTLLAALFAQSQPPDGGTWNRRPPGAGDYRTVLEVSGLEEIARMLVRPDGRNLAAVCRGREQTFDDALSTHLAELKHLESKPASPKGPGREGGPNPLTLAFTHHGLGQLWSFQGQMARAIEQFERALKLVSEQAPSNPELRPVAQRLRATLGVAHMRRGEIENCVHDGNADRCILPVAGAGRHAQPSGSEAAARYFIEYLQQDPGDPDVKWLLNIVAMTLGRHPDGVPPPHRIPLAAYGSPSGAPRFVDTAARVGLGRVGRAGGAAIEDFNNDDRLDVAISSVDPCEPLHLFLQQEDGRFGEAAGKTGLEDQLGGINLTHVDFDNDGWMDLFVMRGGWEFPIRNSLLRNNHDGTFTDVTVRAGIAEPVRRTHAAAWADFDNDGWVDLFIGHEEAPSRLLRNNGDGTFADVSKKAGVDRTAFTKGAAWGDIDGDVDPDLYVSNYGGPNFLYRNNGDGTFTEIAREAGVHLPLMSFPTWFFDYDNDGRMDLFVASFMPSLTEAVSHYVGAPRRGETMRLYRNTGSGRFEDATASAGLARVVPTMGANFGDVDNDGSLDIYLGTGAPSYTAIMPNVMFRNAAGTSFTDVSVASGTMHLQKGHGVAFADLNADGHQDLFVNVGGFVPGDAFAKVLFTNPGGGGNWVKLRLRGVKTNRAAIGAKIIVRLKEGKTIYREVTSGGSFGASPFLQHIGVGTARRIDTIEIHWPASGARQSLRDVTANQTLDVVEPDR